MVYGTMQAAQCCANSQKYQNENIALSSNACAVYTLQSKSQEK